MKGSHPNIAVCSFEIGQASPGRVQLLPEGKFRSIDGSQPKAAPHFQMNAAIAKQLIKIVGRKKNPLVIDYEHQTIMTAKNGLPAPAAGWWKGIEMEYVDGVGLFATNVDWTDDAKKMIAKGEYKFISLVFPYDNNGVPTDIHHAGLTNFPAIDGMEELTVMAAKLYTTEQSTEDETMNEQLLALLCLATTATEDDAIAALKSIIEKKEAAEAAVIAGGEQVAALKTQLEEAQGGDVDLSKYVSVEVVEELKGEVATLKGQLNESEVNDLVDVAMSEGKILPAQEKWARELGKSDIAALKSYIEETPVVAALKGKQTDGDDINIDDDGNVTLNESQIALCKQMGVTEEAFAEELKAQHGK